MSTTKTSAQVPKLRFPGFEGEWWTKPLQALSQKSITYGIVQTGEPVEGGIKCVRVIDLTKAKIDHLALITTTPEISRSYKRTILEEGEIMVALRGDIGLVALVPAELAGSNLTRGIARIAPKRSEVTPGFLLWSLRTDHAKTEFNKQVNGSALKEIPINGLNKVEAQLTTVPEQQKIASFLTAVDGRIEQLSRKKALLEAYKKGVMQQLFTQTLRFQNDHGHDFPDWEEKTLGEVVTINPKARELPDSFTYIDLESVDSGVLHSPKQIDKADAPSRAQRLLQPQDILYQTVRPYQMNNLFFDLEGTYVASTGYAQLRVTKHNPRYIYHALHVATFVNAVMDRCTGTSFPAINSKDLGDISIPVPSLPEQTKIAGFLSALDGKIGAVGEQMRQTQAWKKGLLQQMFV